MKKESDSEFDFLPVAGQMKLTEIQKAQIKRIHDKAMEELKSVLERVRLTMGEYSTADKELKTYESPDSEFEAEEEKRKIRERKMKKKMKRKERRAKRIMDRPEEEENKEEGKEEWNGHDVQSKTADQTTISGIEDTEKGGEEGTSPDSSGSSSEEHEDGDDDADERKTTQETWKMPGQVQRKISRKTLFKVSEKIKRTNSNLPKHNQMFTTFYGKDNGHVVRGRRGGLIVSALVSRSIGRVRALAGDMDGVLFLGKALYSLHPGA